MSEIKEKIAFIKNSCSHLFKKGNWSWYRFFIFITSVRGQKRILSFIWKVIRYFLRKFVGLKNPYDIWMKNNFPTLKQLETYKENATKLSYQPKFSVLLPVYNPPEDFLKQAIDSVINQVYTNWELCIADDLSTNKNIRRIIKEYSEKDERIKYVFRKENGCLLYTSPSPRDRG